MSEKQQRRWEDLTDEQVAKATELLVEKNELKLRKVQVAILKAMGHSPDDALLQISTGEKAHCDDFPIWM